MPSPLLRWLAWSPRHMLRQNSHVDFLIVLCRISWVKLRSHGRSAPHFMILRPHHWRLAALALALMVAFQPTRGYLLDWSTITWTPGSLTNSYDIDTSNPGNDITIAFSGDTARLTNYWGVNSPFIVQTNQGGYANVAALMFAMDYQNIFQAITVTVTFNYSNGVYLDDFQLFDVDRGNNSWTDQIRKIWGTTTNGSIIAATLTNLGPDLTILGTGTNQSLVGTATANNTSSEGNVTIKFNTTGIKSFQFTYGSYSNNSPANPNEQHIQLYDISYRVVPEVGLAWAPLVVFGVASVLVYRRRASA